MTKFFQTIFFQISVCFSKRFQYAMSSSNARKVVFLQRLNFGDLLTDLSKAFDCLDHELLIAKVNAYGFTLPTLNLIQHYLSNRKQIAKINSSYNEWVEIISRDPQGSVLGPLLFNIFLADLYFSLSTILKLPVTQTATHHM